MPFTNSEFTGQYYSAEYANLVCDQCGETFADHLGLQCSYELWLKPNPKTKPKTVCEKAVVMYERQPYYKKLKGKEQCAV